MRIRKEMSKKDKIIKIKMRVNYPPPHTHKGEKAFIWKRFSGRDPVLAHLSANLKSLNLLIHAICGSFGGFVLVKKKSYRVDD